MFSKFHECYGTSVFFRNEWCLGYNFILQFLSREPGELVWVILGKITAQWVRITCVIRQSPLTESEKSIVTRVLLSSHGAMSISPLGTRGGHRSNREANECCCPGRTGQWHYPSFRGKSNTKRKKLFSQDHLSGVNSVLCSAFFLSIEVELQVSPSALNLLVSFLKMLTWKGHGLRAYQNNSCWFLSWAFYSHSYALGLCPNLFLMYRVVRWECEKEPGWKLTVSICFCCLRGGFDPASRLEVPVGHQTDAPLYR